MREISSRVENKQPTTNEPIESLIEVRVHITHPQKTKNNKKTKK